MGAQRFKGEIEATLNGETVVLVADMNALAAFEEATGSTAMKFLGDIENGRASIIHSRALLHAALLRHRPKTTVEEAGNMLSEDTLLVVRLLNAAMGAPEAPAGGAGNVKAPAKTRR